ncbi:hypothetical protein HAX54_022349, partial [Datura stramonium]|nr:hypothetical protein [Datura stramonium]
DNSGLNENEGLNFNLTNESTITEVAAVCAEFGDVIYVEASKAVMSAETYEIASVSKRGRNINKKVMSDYVTTAIKKKSRVSRK